MAAYSELPVGLSLIVCDTIIEDKLTSKKSLIGLFGRINVRSLPVVHPSMSLLITLTGGNGTYPMEVQCTHAELDAPVFSVTCDVKCDSPMQVLELVFQLKNIRFPLPDYYWIKVLIDGVPIMMRPLQVVARPASETPSEMN